MQGSLVVAQIRGIPVLARGALLACALLAGCGSSSSDSAGMGSTQGVGNASASADTQSTNWTGYVRTASLGGFHQVSGSWTVPQPDCSAGTSTASAIWPGIGGFKATDQTLIQAGTEQDCNGGSASYYAWWEGYPAPSQDISTSGKYPVQAGDRITVTISGSALLFWNITIDDATAGWTYSTTTPFLAAGESAEWIVEAPTVVGIGSGGQTTLSNFGRVSFSGLAANSAAAALTASDAIDMVNASGGVIASPSAPGAGGAAFDVCYGAASCD